MTESELRTELDRALKESFDVAKVTNVIFDEIQKAFTKGFDLGVKFASDNGTPIIKTVDKIIGS